MSTNEGVLFVADAAEDAGLGHLSRSSALAAALRDRGCRIHCLGFEATGAGERDGVEWSPETDPARIVDRAERHRLVVLDTYRLPAADIDAIASSVPIAVMHDFGEPRADATLVIAPSDPKPSRPGVLRGLRHACLSSRFFALPPRSVTSVSEVLVSTGGGDPGRRAVQLAVAVSEALPAVRVRLVRGPQAADAEAPRKIEMVGPFENLLQPLMDADLVVCGAGSTAVEACATGAPVIVQVLAPNQEPLATILEEADAVVRIEGETQLEPQLVGLARDPVRRALLSRAAQAAVDGRGAARVAAEIEQLLG